MTESSREKAEKEAKEILLKVECDRDWDTSEVVAVASALLSKEREAWNACLDECKKVINQEGRYRHFWMKETMIMLVDQLRK